MWKNVWIKWIIWSLVVIGLVDKILLFNKCILRVYRGFGIKGNIEFLFLRGVLYRVI